MDHEPNRTFTRVRVLPLGGRERDYENTDVEVRHCEDTTQQYPWYAVAPDNTHYGFDTEMAACIFQRGWRAAKGLDIMTGEPL